MNLKKGTMINMAEVLTALRIAEGTLLDCDKRIHSYWPMDTSRLKTELTYIKEMLHEHSLELEAKLVEECEG